MLESLDYKWVLAGIAMLISIINVSFYLRSVFIGKTKPHMFTWLIWGIVTGVVALAQLSEGAGAGGYYILYLMAVCLTIAALAYFKGIRDIKKSDIACLVVCFIAIIIWPLTKDPLYSVLLLLFIDLLGYYPTIRKSYNNPHEENIKLFAITILTYSLSILALSNYNFITIIFPATMVLMASIMVLFLAIRRHQLGCKIWD